MATTQPPLKVLFFSPYFYPYISGLTQFPYRFFTQHQENMMVTCLTFAHQNSLPPTASISPRCTVYRMPFLFRVSKGFISPHSLAYFWNELDRNDVVLLNLPSVEGVFLALFAWMKKKPIVSLLHCEVLLPPGLANRIVNVVLNCGVWIQLALSKKIIVYTTDYYADKPMYHSFRHKMQVILPPIHEDQADTSFLAHLETMKKGRTCIGFCGRIAYEKGIDVLLDALTSRPNTVLFFAGPTGTEVVGEASYFSSIQRALREKNIAFHFFGPLEGPKLSSFYKSLDLLVLPSINRTEAFGMVQVEAMLQGTPVVASNLPGVRIPIRMTKMGKTAEPGNAQDLRKKIDEVIGDRKTYTSTLLQHKARHLFDAQKTGKEVYDTIHHI
jgi:glycosyltransferase involved in cell wall biosynthesis